ncbi:unnamed protein product [Symbiodinium natans]|uniref:Uncharacterized protein n=1 Tax=Symbiodinium natans TaxID=878477 RepID=A0A812NM45_9DINO|nr:unnamed protein product [Symbiodinium natans]
MAVPLAALAAVLALRCHLAGAQQEGSSPDLGAVKSFQDFDEFRMAQVAAGQDRPKHPGGFGHPDSSEMIKVVIGSSLSENQKCVTPPGPVDCPKDLMLKDHTGQYPDEFHIFHHGDQICARRTDATAGWGMNVAVLCLKTSHDAGDYQDSAGEVVFGSSLTSATKCVRDPGHVHCDDTAQQKGRTGEYPDTFHIYHEGSQICAHRTDTHAGWGLHLVVQCKTRGSGGGGFGGGSGSHGGNGGREVVIGESPDSQIKCVDSQPGIYCDDTAKQVGRTGQYPDTFHIYQENGQICAKRTDAPAGWGLNLVLHCKTYGPPIGEIYRTAKIRYCCTKHLFSPACPYDCDALDRHASLGWTSKRRSWCCGNRGMGCRANERPPLPQHGGSGPYNCEIPDTTEDHVPLPDQQGGGVHWNPTDEQPRYNCMHGSKEMWSQDKAQYCKLWLAASEAYRKSGQAFKEGLYDCNTGDESSWSSEQIWWCQHHSSSPHECDAKKKDQWDNSERDFCCILKGIGCPKVVAVPIDDHYGPHGDSDRNDWEDAASLDIIDHPNTKPRPGNAGAAASGASFARSWVTSTALWGSGTGRRVGRPTRRTSAARKRARLAKTRATTAARLAALAPAQNAHTYSKACPFDCQAGLDKWMIGFAPDAPKGALIRALPLSEMDAGHFNRLKEPVVGGWRALPTTPSAMEHALPPPSATERALRTPSATENSFGHGVHHTPARPLHKPHFHEHELDHAHLGQGESAFSPRYTFDDCQNKDDRSKGNLGLCYLSVSFNCQVGLSSWRTWSSQKQAVCCGKKVTCSGHGDGGHSSHGGHYSHGGHFSHGGLRF